VTSAAARARAAMRAIAGTVNDAPPLQLTPGLDPGSVPGETHPGEAHPGEHDPGPRGSRQPARPRGQSRRRRRWSVLAPVAAAAVVIALGATLAIVTDMPNGRVAPPVPSAITGGSGAAPGDTPVNIVVPQYYAALTSGADPTLVFGNARTGKLTDIDTLAPDNVILKAVYGQAADDTTFIVAGQLTADPAAGTKWYRLRISPGSRVPAQLVPLPIGVSQVPAGVALSPDGTDLAVALPGSPATLRLYSIATGALLRSWSATAAGQITAQRSTSDSWQLSTVALRWSTDGRQLGFAWNGSAIRVLDANAPDGDLIGTSKLLAAIGPFYHTLGSDTCDAAQGWQLIEDGQGIVCAGSSFAEAYHTCGANGKGCSYHQEFAVGFMKQTSMSGGGTETEFPDGESTSATEAKSGVGAYLGWANADGSVLIGSLVPDGKTRFGIFRGSKFTGYPALPVARPWPVGSAGNITPGSIAW
jgi:hypothetical protein